MPTSLFPTEHDYVNQIIKEDSNICKFTRNSKEKRIIECVRCPMGSCTKADQINRQKLHQKTEIICGYCNKLLKSKISFQYHLNAYHEDILKSEIQSNEELPVQIISHATDETFDDPSSESDWLVDDVIVSCLFISDPNSPKDVKCIACNQDCTVEASINELKPTESAEIPCKCGKVLKDRQSFYKHYIFFHGSKKKDLKKIAPEEPEQQDIKMEIEIENYQNLEDCSFKYELMSKTIHCCKHLSNERQCKVLGSIRSSKSFDSLNIPCFCGKILKTRMSFQKHSESAHQLKKASEVFGSKSEIVETEKDEVDIIVDTAQTTCCFIRDPMNKKAISCVNCKENCPMVDKIQSSKFFEELYIPCQCGKVLKNRCNFLKHYKIFHEMGLGSPAISKDRKVASKRVQSPFLIDEDSSQFSQNSNCQFMRDDKNQKLIICVTCNFECEFMRRIKTSNMNRELNIPCICGKTIKSRKRYFQHYNFAHSGGKEKSKSCSICSITFDCKRDRFEHERIVHNIEFKFPCHQCDKTFYRSDYLVKHLETCGVSTDNIAEGNVMACGVCNFTFMKEDTFRKHLETAHLDADTSDDVFMKKAEEYSSKSEVKSTVATCPHCSKDFSSNLVLQRHIDKIHSNVLIYCEECDEPFVHQSTKDFHMVKCHGKSRAFNCKICEYSCDKKIRFNAHMAKHENPDVKFSCPICQQQFSSFDTMTMHRGRHKIKDPFVCEFCLKQFILKTSYNNHLKLHTGENLHHCGTCNKSFVKKSSLKRHEVKENH